MRKKWKRSELLFPDQGEETVESRASSRASCKKRYKEDVEGNDNDAGSCKKRLVGVAATAPPCGISSLVLPGRGLKRKIGCTGGGVATQMGRKNKIEDDYVKGETLGRVNLGQFGCAEVGLLEWSMPARHCRQERRLFIGRLRLCSICQAILGL